MARLDIKDIKCINKERSIKHSVVKASYTIFEMDNEKYIQLDTYGLKSRVYTDVASQKIQFDKETAAFFVELFKREFNL